MAASTDENSLKALLWGNALPWRGLTLLVSLLFFLGHAYHSSLYEKAFYPSNRLPRPFPVETPAFGNMIHHILLDGGQ